jgi:hypothetical protein
MTRLLGPIATVITCEFGTYPALKVLAALRKENQNTHWGGDPERAKAGLIEAFRPRSKSWEQAVLSGGANVISQAIRHLRA